MLGKKPRRSTIQRVYNAREAPFLDLHVWGKPQAIARRLGPRTRFLAAIGPGDLPRWRAITAQPLPSTCVGFHLEGPYLNPAMAGALDRRAIRPRVRVRELAGLIAAGRGRVRKAKFVKSGTIWEMPAEPNGSHAEKVAAIMDDIMDRYRNTLAELAK